MVCCTYSLCCFKVLYRPGVIASVVDQDIELCVIKHRGAQKKLLPLKRIVSILRAYMCANQRQKYKDDKLHKGQGSV